LSNLTSHHVASKIEREKHIGETEGHIGKTERHIRDKGRGGEVPIRD
jgi:hypothetical protein